MELLVARSRHNFDYPPSLKDVADHNMAQSLLAPCYTICSVMSHRETLPESPTPETTAGSVFLGDNHD